VRRQTEIDYQADSARCFAALRDLPRPVLLESGQQGESAGRFDIVAADPFVTLVTRGERTSVREVNGRVAESGQDPLALLKLYLGEPTSAPAGLPFAGGAIGYFAYDLGRRFERFAGAAVRDIETPDMVVGLYDWTILTDHQDCRTWLVSAGRTEISDAQWDDLLQRVQDAPADRGERSRFDVLSKVSSNLSFDAYGRAFDVIKENIRAGNCYQVNMAQRFEARARGDSWAAYLRLREVSPAPFSAYLQYPEADVLSSSPERFLSVRNAVVETKPIKGTRPRNAVAALDSQLADELRSSGKDRAENVMIVDLLRNDLGKSCAAGSIAVERLFDVESYANVHQLVSTVRGRLKPGLHAPGAETPSG
jgi:para-aminobenzoate synthetase component 1